MRSEELAALARSISQLWGRPLSVTDEPGDPSESIAVGPAGPAVRLPFEVGEGERQALLEIVAWLGRSDETAARLARALAEIEERNRSLITENSMLAELAVRDALTGLYNRGYLIEKLEAEINRAIRFRTPISVLMVDLDHFKDVNDRFGHAAGDRVLRVVGSLLRESCRVYDVPGRYGGEEFCLMLPSTELESTVPVADRIRRRIEATSVAIGRSDLHVTASIGVASLGLVPEEKLFDSSALLDCADRALYRAKNSGRNRIEVWAGGLPEGEH
ncbi:MAG TPA: GGDEF domain-containing protein [Thermoanaerobaculia bacterium]|nr:GGDEF domain-containing protein [Thermoanaerobaculia bacterium]